MLYFCYTIDKIYYGTQKAKCTHRHKYKQMNSYQMYVKKILQRTQWLTRRCYVPNCPTYNLIVLFGHIHGLLQVQQLFIWHSTSLPSSKSVMDCCAVHLLTGSCH